MKKIIITSLVSAFVLFSTIAAEPTIIQGKWDRAGNDVTLYKIISGRLETVSTFVLQEDRAFGFIISPEKEGFYVVGSGQTLAKIDKYVVYLKPGDKVNLEVDNDSYKLVGKNTRENIALEQWHNKILPLEIMSTYSYKNMTTYVDYFPLLDEFIEEGFVPKKTKNKLFESAFESYRKYDLIGSAVHFLHTPRTAHPHTDDLPDFYRNISIETLTEDASILDFPFGSSLISQLLYLKSRLEGNESPLSIEQELALIKNDTVKGEYIAVKSAYNKTYVGFKSMIDPLMKYVLTDDQKARVTATEEKLAKERKDGEPAINFTYNDIDGKEVSLSDFKGKLVLIDVWATWCGPCKAEIPHLKTLIDDYDGKDIVFMSVSVDEKKDFEKWEQFVKDEALTGVQLFAGGFGSDIARLNGINSIPRFMLIDKDGNVISKDSPRPSSKELRVLIDSYLK